MPTLHETEQLFLLAKQGDKAAFERLYQEYVTPVYRVIYVKVRHKDLAEDLTQTVFIKALETLGRHTSGNTNPLTYFLTIARNTVIDHWRKKKDTLMTTPEETFDKLPSKHPSAHQTLVAAEDLAEIYQAMANLNEDQREVLTLKFMHDQPNEAIAEIMHKSQEAIRQIQSRALKQLRQKMIPTT